MTLAHPPAQLWDQRAGGQPGCRYKPERRRDGQGCFQSPSCAISITPLPVFVIPRCHYSVSTRYGLCAQICAPVTHIGARMGPRVEDISWPLQFKKKWLVIFMMGSPQKQCGAEEIYSSSEMVGLTAGMNVTNISKKTTDFHFSNIWKILL